MDEQSTTIGTPWTFTTSINHPDGTDVYVSMTVPADIAADWRHRVEHSGEQRGHITPEPVLECSELAQMGAVRAMSAYVATKNSNESRGVPF